MKRYILSLPEYEKWSSKIVRAIGKSRKIGGGRWTEEFEQKDIKRFVISGLHHLRRGSIGKSRVYGITALWDCETGENLSRYLSYQSKK